jgi:hypothetical protein
MQMLEVKVGFKSSSLFTIRGVNEDRTTPPRDGHHSFRHPLLRNASDFFHHPIAPMVNAAILAMHRIGCS